MKHLDIIISGKVQGVFFRATAKAVADQLGIKGIAKNTAGGTVFIEAEGDDFSLDLFLEFCNKGSDRSVVEKVDTTEGEIKNYRNFEVVKK
jgi:acylphosphatase